MSIMEMEEIKSAIAGVESKVEYNGGGIDDLKANVLLNAGSVVKSVQRGTYNFTASSTGTKSISINTINTDKSLLIVSCNYSESVSSYNAYHSLVCTLNSNNIECQYRTEIKMSNTLGISWQVIEFY